MRMRSAVSVRLACGRINQTLGYRRCDSEGGAGKWERAARTSLGDNIYCLGRDCGASRRCVWCSAVLAPAGIQSKRLGIWSQSSGAHDCGDRCWLFALPVYLLFMHTHWDVSEDIADYWIWRHAILYDDLSATKYISVWMLLTQIYTAFSCLEIYVEIYCKVTNIRTLFQEK